MKNGSDGDRHLDRMSSWVATTVAMEFAA